MSDRYKLTPQTSASCMTSRGRLTPAGRVRSLGTLDADREGPTRLEILATDVETTPIGHVPGVDRQDK